MTHEELKAIRLRAAKTAQYLAPYGPEHPAYVRQHLESYPATNSALDVPALLAYIDELHCIVHDLRQEPGWELGRQEERREVLFILMRLKADFDHYAGWYDRRQQAIDAALSTLGSRGPVAPHLAPDDLRRENEALRAALRDLVVAEDEPSPTHYYVTRDQAAAAARRLLGNV